MRKQIYTCVLVCTYTEIILITKKERVTGNTKSIKLKFVYYLCVGVRDYIHIMDLALGHVKAMAYQKTYNPTGFMAINLGTGKGYSVLEVIRGFEKASGKKIPYKIVGRRPGDISASFANASIANKKLNWIATKTIDDMCTSSSSNY